MKVRKKPIVVDAVHVTTLLWQAKNDWKALPDWFVRSYEAGHIVLGNRKIWITTLEGEMEAQYNDLIIRGVKGELYPIKPEIYAETYEEV